MVEKFHDITFDHGTHDKLKLFKASLSRWLVVVINDRYFEGPIQIFDLFSGPGCDVDGTSGSPLIICELIAGNSTRLLKSGKKVVIIFNDSNVKKIKELQERLSSFDFNGVSVKIQYFGESFKSVINELLPQMRIKNSFNYVFLDQFGVTEVNGDLFKIMCSIPRVDLLFFMATSFLKRFANTGCFSEVDFIDMKKLLKLPSHLVHRAVAEDFSKLVPTGQEYYMAPFSLKKGPNLYGLIFGSSHIKGLRQFNEACWKVSQLIGDANWITEEEKHLESEQLSLFEDANRPNRLNAFERDLECAIISKELTNNREIYLFTITKGFMPKHAKDVWKNMVNSKKVVNVKRFPINDDVWKKHKELVSIELCHE